MLGALGTTGFRSSLVSIRCFLHCLALFRREGQIAHLEAPLTIQDRSMDAGSRRQSHRKSCDQFSGVVEICMLNHHPLAFAAHISRVFCWGWNAVLELPMLLARRVFDHPLESTLRI